MNDVFLEGRPVYEGSGFYGKTHIQIAVRNSDCIKGVFRFNQMSSAVYSRLRA